MAKCRVKILSLTLDDLVVEKIFDSYADLSTYMKELKFFSCCDQYRIIIDINH